jgi:3-oxoacyl-[acyl-carrier-protein] synthase II
LAPVEFEKQIPRKELRPMDAWQRIGTYAAGLALEDAGVKGNRDLLSRMDLIVAAGAGERNLTVDGTILIGMAKAADPAAFLNARLMNDLRPTQFLAQLSSLLAGAISIVHGVTGASRTFMGEEAAGANAAAVALARIAAGQSDLALVGGSMNAERKDLLLVSEFAGFNWKKAHTTVWSRAPRGGYVLGSLGAFLVLEARDTAQARNARPLARLTSIQCDRTHRRPGDIAAALDRMWDSLVPCLQPEHCAIISGASGAEPATEEERIFLLRHSSVPIRATGSMIGHSLEPQFPMNIALAALAVERGELFAGHDTSGMEPPFLGTLRQAIVTGVGHWRGESLALVEAVH